MADMNKRILLHSPFNFICQQMRPLNLLFPRMQNFINKKCETSYEGGGGGVGGGGDSIAGMPPPPLPRSITLGVNYLVLPEFSALKVNKWNCKIASTHLTTKASWIFTLRIYEWHKWSPKPMKNAAQGPLSINMTSWSAPATRHLLEHRFWVVLNAKSVFSSDGIITSKYSSCVLWAEMELELWANCAKTKKCNQGKIVGNLLNFTSMQWFTSTIPFVILLYRTGLIIKVKVVPFNTTAIFSFLSVCSHWFA